MSDEYNVIYAVGLIKDFKNEEGVTETFLLDFKFINADNELVEIGSLFIESSDNVSYQLIDNKYYGKKVNMKT